VKWHGGKVFGVILPLINVTSNSQYPVWLILPLIV
jgi:hypothetical protein